MIELRPHQQEAVENMTNGCILWGGVGSGKSLTALSYYLEKEPQSDLVIITTAKKRDSLEWEGEAAKLGISRKKEYSRAGSVTVESWNKIGEFTEYEDCFFVFDEQRLVGSGAWVKAFLQIARRNRWIVLSATPGDTWLDYAPVFIANGFYKNITEFKRRHVVYEPWSKFPKVRRYLDERVLEDLRNQVLVEMPYESRAERVVNYLEVEFDKKLFERVFKDRWNPFEERPVKDVAEMFRLMRRVANSDPSRLEMVRKLMTCHPRLIIFYTFNYELDILRELRSEIDVFEWNGHRKDPVPEGDRWVYLVQYTAGAEGWNCTTTDAMILYSLTYSYKNHHQAMGRIDRLDTPFETLYYYILASNSAIDVGIKQTLGRKETFNERKFEVEMEVLGVLRSG